VGGLLNRTQEVAGSAAAGEVGEVRKPRGAPRVAAALGALDPALRRSEVVHNFAHARARVRARETLGVAAASAISDVRIVLVRVQLGARMLACCRWSWTPEVTPTAPTISA
jgi:hypothetical protein